MVTALRQKMRGENNAIDSDINASGEVLIYINSNESSIDAGFYKTSELYSLGDHVWLDSDRNGLQDSDEKPYSAGGLTVRLYQDGNDTLLASQEVNSSGGYLFTGLPAGDYHLRFDTPNGYGITNANQGGTPRLARNADTYDSDINSSGEIRLTLSGHDFSYDAGLYVLDTCEEGNLRSEDVSAFINIDNNESITIDVFENTSGCGNVRLCGLSGINLENSELSTTSKEGGLVSCESEGLCTYTPPRNFLGEDSFDFTVCNDLEESNESKTNISIVGTDVYDPPSAWKTGEADEAVVTWKMFWLNDGNIRAYHVVITDNIPEGTTYKEGSLVCEARGVSTTHRCEYEADKNRVIWEGEMGPDYGHSTEEDTDNELIITFDTTVPVEMQSVENQGQAFYDENGDGEVNESDNNVKNGTPVLTDNPDTPNGDPTVIVNPNYSSVSTVSSSSEQSSSASSEDGSSSSTSSEGSSSSEDASSSSEGSSSSASSELGGGGSSSSEPPVIDIPLYSDSSRWIVILLFLVLPLLFLFRQER
jgi:uncharacterized repeat protein (TIGR01451 family)